MAAIPQLADNPPDHPPEDSINRLRTDQEVIPSSQERREDESQLRTVENPQESSSASEENSNEEEEEEEECGFCLFMKSGPCRDSFIKWEECVEEAEKANEDIVAKCHQVTMRLKDCMENNADYYAPILKAEKELSDAAGEEGDTLEDGNATSNSEVSREAGNQSSSEGKTENLNDPDGGKQRDALQNSDTVSQPSQQN